MRAVTHVPLDLSTNPHTTSSRPLGSLVRASFTAAPLVADRRTSDNANGGVEAGPAVRSEPEPIDLPNLPNDDGEGEDEHTKNEGKK